MDTMQKNSSTFNSNKTTIKSRIFRVIAFLLLTVLMLLTLNRAFWYRDTSEWSSDIRFDQFRNLPANSVDVLFVGSSNVMSAVNTTQLWKDTGMHSYDLCARSQTLPFSYAYIRDALKTQTPDCVVVDVYSVLLSKEYSHLADGLVDFTANLDNLSLSTKTELIENYVDKEAKIMHYFPLLKNHNLYKTWEVMPDKSEQIYMGYCFAPEWMPLYYSDYSENTAEIDEVDSLYINKTINLCRENNIKLIVIKTPITVADEEHAKINRIKQICHENNVDFYDFSLPTQYGQFDFYTMMRDTVHTNYKGAEWLTSTLGQIINDSVTISPDPQYDYLWEKEYIRMEEHRNQIIIDEQQNEPQ